DHQQCALTRPPNLIRNFACLTARGDTERKKEVKRRAAVHCALSEDVSPVLGQDLMRNGQAEACATALLGGEERLENALDHVGPDTISGVGHRDLNHAF